MGKCNCETKFFIPEKNILRYWQPDYDQINTIQEIIIEDYTTWFDNLYEQYQTENNSRWVDLPSKGTGGSKCWLIDKITYKIKVDSPDLTVEIPSLPRLDDQQLPGDRTDCPQPVQTNPDCGCTNSTKGGSSYILPPLTPSDCNTVSEKVIDSKTFEFKFNYKATINRYIEFGCVEVKEGVYAYSIREDSFDVTDFSPTLSTVVNKIEKIQQCCTAWGNKHSCP